MALIPWRPWLGVFEPWEEDMEKFFEKRMPVFRPVLDIYEKKDKVIVETPLAGIEPEKVDISVEKDTITVKGEIEKKSEVDEKDYYRKEIYQGSFCRTASLPVPVIGDKAEAVYENGILKIEIPKAKVSKTKAIKIKVKEKK